MKLSRFFTGLISKMLIEEVLFQNYKREDSIRQRNRVVSGIFSDKRYISAQGKGGAIAPGHPWET